MNIFKRIFIFCFVLITIKNFASPQMSDFIIYKKDTIPTYNLILEQYLQKFDSKKQEKLFGFSFGSGSSFNCWRGYQAIYKVENKRLYLVKIISCGDLKNKNNEESSQEKMKDIFGDEVKNNKVFINWYSGELNFPKMIKNNNLIRWDGIFYRIFESETLLSFQGGNLIKEDSVTNYENIKEGIDRKERKNISNALFAELNKFDWNDKKIRTCEDKYIITINETGKISKVKMALTDEEIKEFYDNDEYNYCVNKIRNNLSNLKFDIIKNKGKPISEDIYINIWVEENGKLRNNDD
jgi:hypothetical protein